MCEKIIDSAHHLSFILFSLNKKPRISPRFLLFDCFFLDVLTKSQPSYKPFCEVKRARKSRKRDVISFSMVFDGRHPILNDRMGGTKLRCQRVDKENEENAREFTLVNDPAVYRCLDEVAANR